jgi:EmrB/QacA subfamily drug resistance transporter
VNNLVTERPNLALTVIVIGVIISAVDSTIVILALPTMMRALHAGLSTVVWIVMAYLLLITLLATQVGKLGDMFGRVRMYEIGFIIFVLGSAWCGITTGWMELVLARIAQGIGGALITANSSAIIADVFPSARRGRAYGFIAVGWNIGAILGILLGGFLTTFFSWRWIFYINVPIGIAALILSLFVLRESTKGQKHQLDPWGFLTMGIGLASILLAMTRLASLGWQSSEWFVLLVGASALGAFVLIETRQAEPLLHLALFRIRSVSFSFVASFFQGLGGFSVLFLVMMYLQGARGLTPLQASLLLVPGYLLGGVAGPVGGRLTDRWGARWPSAVGLGLQGVAVLLYAHLAVSSSLAWIVVASLVNGLGSGAFFPANNTAVMKSAPRNQYGIASGMLRTFGNIGMVLSFAAAIVMTSTKIPRGLAFAMFVGTTHLSLASITLFVVGLHTALYLSILMLGLACVASLMARPVPSSDESTHGALVQRLEELG